MVIVAVMITSLMAMHAMLLRVVVVILLALLGVVIVLIGMIRVAARSQIVALRILVH